MQRDIQPNEIDWVFCWRTSTGEICPGARDTHVNGAPVHYRPEGQRSEDGLITIVDGRARPRRSLGFPLNDQSGLSRMGLFRWGYVTRPSMIPARNDLELKALQEAAHEAIAAGEASEWTLASVRANGREHGALHVGAPTAIVRKIATRVNAPWILTIDEKDFARDDGTTWVDGARIVCSALEGGTLATLDANTYFDTEPLPTFAATSPRRSFDGVSSAPPTSRAEYRVFGRPTSESGLDALAEEITDHVMAALGPVIEEDADHARGKS